MGIISRGFVCADVIPFLQRLLSLNSFQNISTRWRLSRETNPREIIHKITPNPLMSRHVKNDFPKCTVRSGNHDVLPSSWNLELWLSLRKVPIRGNTTITEIPTCITNMQKKAVWLLTRLSRLKIQHKQNCRSIYWNSGLRLNFTQISFENVTHEKIRHSPSSAT